MAYLFDLVCPSCNKTSQTSADFRVPPPKVNCGDCLMEKVEIVELKVVKVSDLAEVDPRAEESLPEYPEQTE